MAKHWMRKESRERGVESAAILLVMPVLVILVFALVDISVMFTARAEVAAVARDTARAAAADGGDNNPRTNTIGHSWSYTAKTQLFKSSKCTVGRCLPGQSPTVSCSKITRPDGTTYTSTTSVEHAGDLITCTIKYPYRGINQDLLDSAMGLGFGQFLKPFKITASARAETGDLG